MLYWQTTNDKPKMNHPSVARAKFSGKEWKFTYWDRDAREEKELPMDKEVIVVGEWMGVQGFVDKGYWSNEVFNTSDEVLQIRASDDNKMKFEGTWKDIKDKVKGFWLSLWKHIHFVYPGDDKIWTIKLKGMAWVQWSNFLEEHKFAPNNYKIKVEWMKDEKKWAIKFKVPVFAIGSELTEEDKAAQIQWATELWEYHEATKIGVGDISTKQDAEDTNELPFN